MTYNTALRGYAAKRLEEIGSADIIMGVPCFNNQETIAHVVQMLTHGLAEHYNNKRSVIFVADGGSTDDSREAAREFEIKPWQEKLITIYRGPAGKGSALRSIFEAAVRLRVKACGMVDSDLRSITGDWVKYLVEPVLANGFDFVAPLYVRHKYDGTITNNVVYNLTRALYGKRIRQPIGGDFAISRKLAQYYIGQDVWDTDVARYGIDIWMTTSAVVNGFKVCQANLGVKVHDAKDPAAHLGPMFRQVIWTLFSLMERHEQLWQKVSQSEPVETFMHEAKTEPEPINVDPAKMTEVFRTGYKQFGMLWKDVLSAESFAAIREAAEGPDEAFHLSTEAWVKILYELAATFHAWNHFRMRLVELAIPLYYARVASFVLHTWEMSNDEAEELVEAQALKFEENKDYLLKVWAEKEQQAAQEAKKA